MNYRCLSDSEIEDYPYRLIPVREEEVLKIKNWRNEQLDVLRQEETLTDEDQITYFKKEIWPTFEQKEPEQLLFSFLNGDECIGYGGLTHIDWDDRYAEVSFLLATERTKDIARYKEEFGIFLDLLKQLAFEDLEMKRLFTETYDIRPYHVEVLEEHDFFLTGRLKGRSDVDLLIHECEG